jgi:hypothetical protein
VRNLLFAKSVYAALDRTASDSTRLKVIKGNQESNSGKKGQSLPDVGTYTGRIPSLGDPRIAGMNDCGAETCWIERHC